MLGDSLGGWGGRRAEGTVLPDHGRELALLLEPWRGPSLAAGGQS